MTQALKSPFIRYGALLFAIALAMALLFPGGIRRLVSSNEFLPHSTCYLRNPQMIRLHVITDMLIGLAYVSISSTLGYLVWRASKDIPFHWMFLAFGIFIVSCGFTHFMEVWTVWQSVYWLAGYVKMITAIASLVTAIALFPLVPKVFALINSVKVSEERRVNLERAHFELQRSMHELADQKAQLEAANKELEMFTYSIAHDLRAPLRGMRNFAELLQVDHAPKLDHTAADYTKRIAVGAEKMTNILNDLLTYSQVNRGDVKVEPISAEEVIADVVKTFQEEAQQRNAKIQVAAGPERVLAETTLFSQALTNIIGNALKYVPNGVAPAVRIRTERRGERLRIWVEDNGIGIDEEHSKSVFNLFERLAPQYPGTGLGLAIARRAMNRIRGHIGLERNEPRGCKFWIELPIA